MSLSVGFVFSHSSLHAMGITSSLTEVPREQIVTSHGEGYTEWNIAAKLRCSKPAVPNANVKYNAERT